MTENRKAILDLESSHRQKVAQTIHSIWSNNGSDLSGLALPFLDGRVDLLGSYVTLSDFDHNDSIKMRQNFDNHHGPVKIAKEHAKQISYQTFFEQYMEPNQPVLIKGLTNEWKASKTWVITKKDQDLSNDDQLHGQKYEKDQFSQTTMLKPNLDLLVKLFGHENAPVHIQSRGGFTIARPHTNHGMTVKDFVDWWENHYKDLDSSRGVDSTEKILDTDLYYLKDWKFTTKHSNYSLYQNPTFFQDDWLNQDRIIREDIKMEDINKVGHINLDQLLTKNQNKYQFIYLGPKGTSTRLHADVLFSYSWSSNICGVKRWYLVPPEYSFLLKNVFGNELAPHLHIDMDLENNDNRNKPTSNSSKSYVMNGADLFYPGLKKARMHTIEVIQYPGETIFVPSGW